MKRGIRVILSVTLILTVEAGEAVPQYEYLVTGLSVKLRDAMAWRLEHSARTWETQNPVPLLQ